MRSHGPDMVCSPSMGALSGCQLVPEASRLIAYEPKAPCIDVPLSDMSMLGSITCGGAPAWDSPWRSAAWVAHPTRLIPIRSGLATHRCAQFDRIDVPNRKALKTIP